MREDLIGFSNEVNKFALIMKHRELSNQATYALEIVF